MGRSILSIHRQCYACGTTKYDWVWNLNPPTDLALCGKCYYRIYEKPRDKNTLRIGRKEIRNYFPQQRTGTCSYCGDKPRHITQLHHEVYLMTLPFFGRVELCPKCHIKETFKRY